MSGSQHVRNAVNTRSDSQQNRREQQIPYPGNHFGGHRWVTPRVQMTNAIPYTSSYLPSTLSYKLSRGPSVATEQQSVPLYDAVSPQTETAYGFVRHSGPYIPHGYGHASTLQTGQRSTTEGRWSVTCMSGEVSLTPGKDDGW